MTEHTAQNQTHISELPSLPEGQQVKIYGWLQNKRDSKGIVFMTMRDGSGFVQCVVEEANIGAELFDKVKRLGAESSLIVEGTLRKDERQMGGSEVQVSALEIISESQDYPITPKEHGVDFLMERRHLWLRSRKQWAIMRIRNTIIFSIHRFFQERGFVQMDAPIFTGNACEGTTNLFSTDFFENPAYLSQSGQLYGEAMAMAMGKIYTFGPTFRAEKSKTRRHLSEFWMIEPEMAFYDLDMTMDVIEDFLKFIINEVINNCAEELRIIERDVQKLQAVNLPFPRITYERAVRIIKGLEDVDGQNSIKTLEADLENVHARIAELESDIARRESALKAGGLKKGEIKFNEDKIRAHRGELADLQEQARNIPQWLQSARDFEEGDDFGGSDETVLTRLFNSPIMVYNWPKPVKAFYMKEADDAPGYVRGVDVLAPEGYGEIVGGGERETDIDKLVEAINHHQLPMEAFEWYLDLRRFGSIPHSGFGLGLERIVSYVCKLPHVRESIPFPRFIGNLLP